MGNDDSRLMDISEINNYRPQKGIKCIYFLLEPEFNKLKIGRASDFKGRFSSLRSEVNKNRKLCNLPPTNLKILAVIYGEEELEKEIHHKFCKYRVCREWFDFNSKIKEYIEYIQKSNSGTLEFVDGFDSRKYNYYNRTAEFV